MTDALKQAAHIDYSVVHEFAGKHRLNYDELCVMVRAALSAPQPAAPQVGPVLDERKAFEEWAESQYGPILRDPKLEYTYTDVRAGWRAWQARAALSAPQPAAPQVVPDGMVLVPIEPPIHAVARLPGTETEARRTYSRVIASASGGLVAYSCRDECEGGKHAACGDWCGNQEACLAVFKAVIPDAALPPAQAVPLTDGQIVDEAFRQEWGAGAFCAGVRFAERAHGIKQPGSDT